MRSVALIFAVLLAILPSMAQVSSQVVDSISGEPVEFACVSNKSHTIGFMADAEGRFPGSIYFGKKFSWIPEKYLLRQEV